MGSVMLPPSLRQPAGLKPVEITVCLTAWSVTNFVLQVPSGVIADRWSRRQILAWSQLVRGLGFVAWLLYPHFWGIFAGLQLWGIKSAFTSGTFEALLYDERKDGGLYPHLRPHTGDPV